MVSDGREIQRRMYLSVGQLSYARPSGRRRLILRKAEECLRTHAAGCRCWRRAVGGSKGR